MRNNPWWRLGAVGMAVAVSVVLFACDNQDRPRPIVEQRPVPRGEPDARVQPAPHTTPDARVSPARRRVRVSPDRLGSEDIIMKATDALGGAHELRTALRRCEIESRGIYRGKAYTAHAYVGEPRLHVIEVSMKTAGRATTTMTTTMGSSGQTCWSKRKGKVRPCSDRLNEALVSMRKAALIATLWPLLAAGYTQEYKGVVNLDGKPTHVVEANDCFQPLVSLYFDKTTFKLVRYRWKGRPDGQSKVGTIVVKILEYKKVGRVTIPWKRVMTFNGTKVLQDEVTKVKLGKVDAAKIIKPPGLPVPDWGR